MLYGKCVTHKNEIQILSWSIFYQWSSTTVKFIIIYILFTKPCIILKSKFFMMKYIIFIIRMLTLRLEIIYKHYFRIIKFILILIGKKDNHQLFYTCLLHAIRTQNFKFRAWCENAVRLTRIRTFSLFSENAF